MVEHLDPGHVANVVRQYLDRPGVSRERLAEQAGVGLTTVKRLLDGSFSPRTLQRLARIVPGLIAVGSPAASEYGGYTKEQAIPYLGHYALVMPGTRANGPLMHSYPMEILWDPIVKALCLQGVDGEIRGNICLPVGSMHMFVSLLSHGWVTQLVFGRMTARRSEHEAVYLKGFILTVVEGGRPTLVPAFLYKFTVGEYQKELRARESNDSKFRFRCGDFWHKKRQVNPQYRYEEYRKILLETMENNNVRWTDIPDKL